jgi:autophagy-related protein 2
MPIKTEEPIMTLGSTNERQQDVTFNPLIQLNDEFDEHFGQKDIPNIPKPETGTTSNDCKTPVYIRQFVFSPDVTIRLDYEGRHIDFSQGSLNGLLMGLAQLNCSEITLKRIVHKHG